MMRIIDGKRYNTETATKVASWGNNLGRRDFNNVDETLYVTAKKNWFLHGEGGASSAWAVSAGQNAWQGGEDIRVMNALEARDWLERHGFCLLYTSPSPRD